MALQHLRSSTAHKRPIPTVMSAGQIAINTNETSPGLFFKDSNGDLVKVGPVHIGTTAPNSSPASVAATALVTGTVYQILTVGTSDFTLVGASANTVGTIFTATGTTTGTGTVSGQQGVEKGEQWLDTTGGTYVLKIYDGTAWRSESGTFVDVSGDTMTGDLVMNNANIVFEGATADDFETTLTVTDPTADRTITLPNVTGTVVTTGDTGTVTSTMIADGTIVNADINASAAIAGTKIDPDFGSQTIKTTGVFSAADGAAATPSITFTSDTNTGIYRPGADQVAISTNGTQRINIEADGDINIDSGGVFYDATNNRLAIGTTSPTEALTISGNIKFTETSAFIKGAYNANLEAPNNIEIIGDNDNSGSGIIDFRIGSSSRARIDSSGRLLVGTSTAPPISNGQRIYVSGTGSSDSGIQCVRWNASFGGYALGIGRSRSGTPGTYSIVGNNDDLGSITWYGDDGTDLNTPAASINAYVDGTPGTNDMPGRLVFSTTADGSSSPTERMRIRENGQVLINRTSSATGSILEVDASSNVAQFHHTGSGDTIGIYMRHGRGLSGFSGKMITFRRNDDTEVGSVVIGVSSTAYNTSSDYRLKENIVAVADGIARLQQLKPSRFNFIDDPDRIVDGFIAHEVQTVVPEAITGEKDAVDDEGNPVYQGIDQSKLVPLLTAALQEAIGEIESLKARVAALEAN